jgi:hypothetical protein
VIEWGLLFVLFLLLAFIVSSLNKRYKRSRAATAKPARWKLFKDKPDDWKDAVYNPKGFRNKK